MSPHPHRERRDRRPEETALAADARRRGRWRRRRRRDSRRSPARCPRRIPRVKALSKAALAAVKADAAKPRPTTKAGRKYKAERNAKLRERAAAKASTKAAADEDRDALRAIVGRRLRLRLPDEDARRMCRIVDFDARTGAYRVRYDDEGDEADVHLERADIRCGMPLADVRRALRVAGKKRFQFESANRIERYQRRNGEEEGDEGEKADVEGTRLMTEAEGAPKTSANVNALRP